MLMSLPKAWENQQRIKGGNYESLSGEGGIMMPVEN